MPKVSSHMYMCVHVHTHTPNHSSKLFYFDLSFLSGAREGLSAGRAVHLEYGRAKLMAGADRCVPVMALVLMDSVSWCFWTLLCIIMSPRVHLTHGLGFSLQASLGAVVSLL